VFTSASRLRAEANSALIHSSVSGLPISSFEMLRSATTATG